MPILVWMYFDFDGSNALLFVYSTIPPLQYCRLTIAFPLWIVGLICVYIAYYLVKRALYLYNVIDEDKPTKLDVPVAPTTAIPTETGSTDHTALILDMQRQLRVQQEQQALTNAMLARRAQEEQLIANR